jgi:thiol-disulfide isomerase/thioredoxin
MNVDATPPPGSSATSRRRRVTVLIVSVILLVGLFGAIRFSGSISTTIPRAASTDQNFGPAPDFSVPLIGGGDFRLSKHLSQDGRPVFLNFWASWCVPCIEEMPDIDAAAREHPDVLFLGVAVEDDPDAARRFAADVGVSYLLAIDETESIIPKYPIFGLPTTWVISSDGQILAKVTGQLQPSQIADLVEVALAG